MHYWLLFSLSSGTNSVHYIFFVKKFSSQILSLVNVMCQAKVINIYNCKQSINCPWLKLLGFSKCMFYWFLLLLRVIYYIFLEEQLCKWQRSSSLLLFLCRLSAKNLWYNEHLVNKYAIVNGIFFFFLLKSTFWKRKKTFYKSYWISGGKGWLTDLINEWQRCL